MNRTVNYSFIFFVLMVPVLIYLYFLQWKTGTIYGDDLYIYKNHEGLNSFSEKIGMPVSFGKYRPVHGLSMHFLIELFQKNTGGYYVFNTAVQVINTFLFALTINLFLRSASLSLLCGLTAGLSRFSYFNITQLLNGGALEGLAMTFFLLFLFFFVRALISETYSPVQKQREIIRSILFANLSMYTHERYIVLFLFVIAVMVLYPGLQFTRKQKTGIVAISIASIVLNVLLKKAVYNMPFFMGTASTGMKFSLSPAADFFTQAVLSILQVNYGPEYLVGIQFTSLPFPDKLLVVLFLAGILTVLFLYLRNVRKAFAAKQPAKASSFWLFLFLAALFGLFLVPALLTIRLEQRWLQASYAIFVLMFILAFTSISFKSNYTRGWVLSLFIVLLLWIDFNYLNKGGNNTYMASAEKTASGLENAVHNGTIHTQTKRLFVWEKQRDANTEAAITWELAEGYFFNFYENQAKQIIFVDASSRKNHGVPDSALSNFDKNTDQVVELENNVTDITSSFLLDSVKEPGTTGKINAAATDNSQDLPKKLIISARDMDRFTTAGFYENENGIRWTNGTASIVFGKSYRTVDSLFINLDTYMPELCKNVRPVILLSGQNNQKYKPVYASREGDVFKFVFYFAEPVEIQEVAILSPKIEAGPADRRALSFPFKSLSLVKN